MSQKSTYDNVEFIQKYCHRLREIGVGMAMLGMKEGGGEICFYADKISSIANEIWETDKKEAFERFDEYWKSEDKMLRSVLVGMGAIK